MVEGHAIQRLLSVIRQLGVLQQGHELSQAQSRTLREEVLRGIFELALISRVPRAARHLHVDRLSHANQRQQRLLPKPKVRETRLGASCTSSTRKTRVHPT